MRWKGLIFILVVVAIVIVLGFIFSDKWIEKRLEAAGTAAVGAKVEIDNFDISFTKMYLKWDSLQVADPKDTWKNIITTGKTGIDLEFLPLLRKKYIIENIQLINVKSGTERTTDGKVEKKTKKKSDKPSVFAKTIEHLESEIKLAPAWNLSGYKKNVNVDSVLNLLEIKSPDKIDSLKNSFGEKYQKWDDTLTDSDWDTKLDKIEIDVKSLENADTKSVTGLTTALKTVQTIRADIDSTKSRLARTRNGFASDFISSKQQLLLVDDWITDDYSRALDKAKLPDLSKQNIGMFVFGDQIVKNVNKALSGIAKLRYYSNKFKSDKPKKEKPPRLKGQTIYFPQKNARPKFWVKKIELAGSTKKGLILSGLVENLVSDQRIIGSPTTIKIEGSRVDGAELGITGILEYMTDVPREQFNLKLNGMPLQNMDLINSDYLPHKILKGDGRLVGSIISSGETLLSNVNFKSTGLEFEFKESGNEDNFVKENLTRILKNTNSVDFNADINSFKDNMKFSINSNLDDLFLKQVRSLISGQVSEAQEKIKKEINNRVGAQKKELDDLANNKQSELEDKLTSYQNRIDKELEKIEKKKTEFEARIEEEKGKVGNKIKGLFP